MPSLEVGGEWPEDEVAVRGHLKNVLVTIKPAMPVECSGQLQVFVKASNQGQENWRGVATVDVVGRTEQVALDLNLTNATVPKAGVCWQPVLKTI